MSLIVYILPLRKYAGSMRGGCSVYIGAFKSGLGVDSVESLICLSWFERNGVSEDCKRKWGNLRNCHVCHLSCLLVYVYFYGY